MSFLIKNQLETIFLKEFKSLDFDTYTNTCINIKDKYCKNCLWKKIDTAVFQIV